MYPERFTADIPAVGTCHRTQARSVASTGHFVFGGAAEIQALICNYEVIISHQEVQFAGISAHACWNSSCLDLLWAFNSPSDGCVGFAYKAPLTE